MAAQWRRRSVGRGRLACTAALIEQGMQHWRLRPDWLLVRDWLLLHHRLVFSCMSLSLALHAALSQRPTPRQTSACCGRAEGQASLKPRRWAPEHGGALTTCKQFRNWHRGYEPLCFPCNPVIKDHSSHTQRWPEDASGALPLQPPQHMSHFPVCREVCVSSRHCQGHRCGRWC
jgi:hypothetical protein